MFGLSLAWPSAGLGAFVGAVMLFIGMSAYDSFVDDPGIRKTEQDACTIRTMDAANRAEKAEKDRQAANVRAAQSLWDNALRAQEAARVVADSKAEKDRQDYEQELERLGLSCPLSSTDDQWLLDQSNARDSGL